MIDSTGFGDCVLRNKKDALRNKKDALRNKKDEERAVQDL